jgi:hypothetical protein
VHSLRGHGGPEDGVFTSCSEDEAAVDQAKFPNLASETGPIVITPGDIEEYWREQLDRSWAESLSLEKQRKELEQLICDHDAELEELRTISVEHQRHPNNAEDARRATLNPVQMRARRYMMLLCKIT